MEDVVIALSIAGASTGSRRARQLVQRVLDTTDEDGDDEQEDEDSVSDTLDPLTLIHSDG